MTPTILLSNIKIYYVTGEFVTLNMVSPRLSVFAITMGLVGFML